MLKLKLVVLALAAGLGAVAPVAANETAHGGYEELGKSKDWTAIRFKSAGSDGELTCAIFSRPKASRVIEGSAEVAALRGEKAAFITWQDDVEVSTGTGEVSFLMGAPVVARDAGHQLSIDAGTPFDLYGFEDRAYTREADDDGVIKSIRRGITMAVKAAISDTRIAEDEYSLYGVQAATSIAARVCN